MSKKPKCPEFENHERWLVAYADMMTLLFALFVVLYSIMRVDLVRLQQLSSSIKAAFGMATEEDPDATGFPSGNSRTEGIFDHVRGNTPRQPLATRNRRELAAIISADTAALERRVFERFRGTKEFPAVSSKSDDRVVIFNQDEDGIRISLLARAFFMSGGIRVDKSAWPVLDGIAQAVRGLGRIVRVEGHTDSQKFDRNGMTNWELSGLRAASVVRYLIDRHDFPKNAIYAAGFADSRPLAPNDTEQHRALNRRIDIKILYDTPGVEVDSDSAAAEIRDKGEEAAPHVNPPQE